VFVRSFCSVYRLEHDEVRSRFTPYLRMRGLRFPGTIVYLRALDLVVEYPTLDHDDAVCIAHMEHAGIEEFLSYERDVDRGAGLRWTEPEACYAGFPASARARRPISDFLVLAPP
jgi:predicted nucleic acid-binding protein